MYEVEFLNIQYEFENKIHSYFPDFYLPKRNLVIETKGEYFYNKTKDILEIKRKAVLKNGYYYMIMFKKDIDDFTGF